ncbi:MAG: glycine cleavage T C-terminal barrel domain-containing protein [Fimbriimonadaceae bacterium]
MPHISDEGLAGYRALRESVGRVNIDDSVFFELTGADRVEWLQGQITQDLSGLTSGSSGQACLCSPTGQLLADLRIWAADDRLLIAVADSQAESVERRVEMAVVLEDVELARLTGPWYSVQGPMADHWVASRFGIDVAQTPGDVHRSDGVWILRSDRVGGPGWDVVGHGGPSPEIPNVPDEAVRIASLEAGIPVPGVDTHARTLPPELGSAFESSRISYRKGCYTGQEVLMRIHSRGHTNRTWSGLICEGPVASGDAVSHPSRPDAGTVTRSAWSPALGWIAGAELRNEAANDGDTVEVRTGSGPVRAVVRRMPLRPM